MSLSKLKRTQSRFRSTYYGKIGILPTFIWVIQNHNSPMSCSNLGLASRWAVKRN